MHAYRSGGTSMIRNTVQITSRYDLVIGDNKYYVRVREVPYLYLYHKYIMLYQNISLYVRGDIHACTIGDVLMGRRLLNYQLSTLFIYWRHNTNTNFWLMSHSAAFSYRHNKIQDPHLL